MSADQNPQNSTTGWPIQVHLAIWGIGVTIVGVAGILADGGEC